MKVTATLGAIDVPLSPEEADYASLEWVAILRPGGRGDVPLVTRQQYPGERVLPLPICRQPDDGDDAADVDAWLSSVNKALAVTNTLVIETEDGTSATFITYPSDPLPPPSGPLYTQGMTYRATAPVRVQPFALGDEATISDESVTCPGALDLSTIDTEYPARLTVTIAPATGSDPLHGVWAGLSPDASWTGYLVEAEGNVTGWSLATTDGGRDVCYFNTGGAVSGTVDVTDFPSGAYLLLAECRCSTDAHLDLSTPYGDEAGTDTTHYHWLPVGEVVLPTKKTRGSGAATLTVTAEATTDTVYVSRLAFLPLRWGFVSYHDADGPTDAIASLRAEYEDVYVDDVVEYDNVLGGGLRASGGQLIVIAEDAAGTDDYAASVSVVYRPRRNWTA